MNAGKCAFTRVRGIKAADRCPGAKEYKVASIRLDPSLPVNGRLQLHRIREILYFFIIKYCLFCITLPLDLPVQIFWLAWIILTLNNEYDMNE